MDIIHDLYLSDIDIVKLYESLPPTLRNNVDIQNHTINNFYLSIKDSIYKKYNCKEMDNNFHLLLFTEFMKQVNNFNTQNQAFIRKAYEFLQQQDGFGEFINTDLYIESIPTHWITEESKEQYYDMNLEELLDIYKQMNSRRELMKEHDVCHERMHDLEVQMRDCEQSMRRIFIFLNKEKETQLKCLRIEYLVLERKIDSFIDMYNTKNDLEVIIDYKERYSIKDKLFPKIDENILTRECISGTKPNAKDLEVANIDRSYFNITKNENIQNKDHDRKDIFTGEDLVGAKEFARDLEVAQATGKDVDGADIPGDTPQERDRGNISLRKKKAIPQIKKKLTIKIKKNISKSISR